MKNDGCKNARTLFISSFNLEKINSRIGLARIESHRERPP
jgi:hypothetical protein